METPTLVKADAIFKISIIDPQPSPWYVYVPKREPVKIFGITISPEKKEHWSGGIFVNREYTREDIEKREDVFFMENTVMEKARVLIYINGIKDPLTKSFRSGEDAREYMEELRREAGSFLNMKEAFMWI